jgi:hypothetical protein
MSLERFIKFIKEGEPVSPGTPNRPLQQLDQNIRYLWDVIQAAELGSTVYARSQPVASTVQVGQPVYFNSVTGQFEAAYAAAETDTITGYLVLPDQAQVWGIVATKLHATLADILLFGYAPIDITAAVGADHNVDGSIPAGTWYLSGASVGQLTRQMPPISIPVLKTNASGGVFVNPSFVDFLENHRHYMFELTMLPAGDVTPPDQGDPHVITNVDPDKPGWLPANHTIFGGLAPEHAVFGYNFSQDLPLKNIYPPIPLQSASIQMQRPNIWNTELERRWYGQQLMEDMVIIDRNGIWWMSDLYDTVPWPTLLDTTIPPPPPPPFTPGQEEFFLKFYFTKVGFATDNAVVSSLRSTDNRIKVYCADTTTPATTGALDISLDLALLLGASNLTGSTVFKNFNTTTSTFESGPVVEGIYSTSPNVLLSGTATRTLGNLTLYQGAVQINIRDQPTQELASQLVRLDGVTEENYPVLYLGLPNTMTTSYVVKFEVPADLAYANGTLVSEFNFEFRARVLGRAAGVLPALNVSYYKTGRPVGLVTPVTVTQSYTALPIDLDGGSPVTVQSNQAVETRSTGNLTVNSGDLLYIKVQRVPGSLADGYAGEVGIMQQVGILTAANITLP